MAQKLNARVDFELTNGETVGLTLTWGLLAQLRRKDKHAYTEYSRMVTGASQDDVLGMVYILYAAYLCGLIDETGSLDGAMTEGEFLEVCPNDYSLVARTATELIAPKASEDSDSRSSTGNEG